MMTGKEYVIIYFLVSFLIFLFQFLVTWKSKTKAKARTLKQIAQRGGNASILDLNDHENELMSLVGWNIIEGCTDVPPELIANQSNFESKYTYMNYENF